MLSRVLKISVDNIKQNDTTQSTDISGLKTKVGTVPSGSGNDLQSQITALTERVAALEAAAEE